MIARTIIILFFLAGSVAAEIISGFEPVWEEENTVSNPAHLAEKSYVDKTIPSVKSNDPPIKMDQSVSQGPLGKTWTDPITGLEFIWVPGGCFQMGCDNNDKFSQDHGRELSIAIADIPLWQWPLAVVAAVLPVGCAKKSYDQKKKWCHRDELPVHEVCLDGFYIGKYEVTKKQYDRITGFKRKDWFVESYYYTPISSAPRIREDGTTYESSHLTWDDAHAFIDRLNEQSDRNFRLPTEAEWEYAARSGGKRERYAGSNSIDDVAWYFGNTDGHDQKVGTKKPNGLGIYDMTGNVWEWCSDWYDKDYYMNSPRNNPKGPTSGVAHVVRGGSTANIASRMDVSYRNAAEEDGHGSPHVNVYGDVGFRLAFSLSSTQ